MSIVTPLVDHVDDLWPGNGARDDDVLAELVLASNLLGANRAVSNFGGGNTSAKGTAIDHAGREVAVMWVKGSGSDLATMRPDHFTGLRMDELLPLMERSEMSDEDMVAYLARCQIDPAMPRASIETLLHAFVPASHVHHTHPDGINVLAGTADGERLVQECFGDAAAWIPLNLSRSRARATGRPRTWSATRRAFCGEMRTVRRMALASMVRIPYLPPAFLSPP
jgi:rhamnose utilization protein RhaD (predicted bifunctional aldolase and dehydrogenase)